MRLLITGASGFVGRAVVTAAQNAGMDVIPVVRAARAGDPDRSMAVGDLGSRTAWLPALDGVDAVVHLAARVHIMRETVADPVAAFSEANVAGTLRLCEQAAEAGVRRIVVVSSAKVMGEQSFGRPFREDDLPAPADPYGQSKLDAELAAISVAARTGLEVVRVRPVLVVGPGVGGNLERLLRLLALGIPLPLAGIDNRRSLIGRESLAEFLLLAARHPAAPGEAFLAADEPAVSTPTLVRALARGLARPARLWFVPPVALKSVARLIGAGAAIERLVGSLEVDVGKARRLLGWSPSETVEEALIRTGAESASRSARK